MKTKFCAVPITLFLLCICQIGYGQSNVVPASNFDFHESHINVGGANGGSGTDAAPTLSGFYGMRTWDVNGCNWFYIEPTAGTYNWACLDTEMATLYAAGVTDVMYTMGNTNSAMTGGQGIQDGTSPYAWSCYPPLTAASGYNTSDYDATTVANFITALLNRYSSASPGVGSGHARITRIEDWNEAYGQNPGYWCASASMLNQHMQNVWNTVQAWNTANSSVAPIKVNSPVLYTSDTATDCTPATSSTDGNFTFYQFLKTYGTSYFDALSKHFYPYPDNVSPEAGGAGQLSAVYCQLDAAYQANSGAAYSSKPLWNTEYAPNAGSGAIPNATIDLPAYVSRQLLWEWGTPSTLASAGSDYRLVRNYWYMYDCCSDTGNSILCAQGNNCTTPQALTGAGQAWYYTAQWMTGSTLASCTVSGSFYTCPMTESNGKTALAVWSTGWDSTGTSTYSFASGTYADFRDLCGNTVSLGSSSTCNTVTQSSTSTSVNVGDQPVLLETASSAPASSAPAPPQGLTATVQ
jgi:hypothetical protein